MPRRPRWSRWPVVALAAAVAVVAVLAVPALVADRGPDDAPAGVPDRLDLGFPRGHPPTRPAPWEPPTNLAVLDAPGWTLAVGRVLSYTTEVKIAYQDGDGSLSLAWIQSSQYADYSFGSSAETRTRPLDVLGVEGRHLMNGTRHVVLTPPSGRYFLFISASGVDGPELRSLVRHLRSVATLTLPPQIIDPTEAAAAAGDVYAGAELPDGFDPLPVVGWNTPSTVISLVVGDIRCGYARAYVEGDRAERAEVLATLGRNHRWPLVQAVPSAGDELDGLVRTIDEEDDNELLRGC